MDAASAALIGTTIGTVATITVAAIASVPPLLTARRAHEREDRKVLGGAIQAVVEGIVEDSRPSQDETEEAARRRVLGVIVRITALGMAVPKGYVTPTLFASTALNMTSEHIPALATFTASQVTICLPAWFNGTMSDADLERARRKIVELATSLGVEVAPGE